MHEMVMLRNSSHIVPSLHIWGWEIPVYLFLGGMTAGLMILVSIFALRNGKGDPMSRWVRWSTFVAPAMLSLGMVALMLDLSYKPHIFRFYTAFRLGSPMSWGSWILVGIYPVTLLLGLLYLNKEETEWLVNFKPLRMFGLGKLIAWLQKIIAPYKKHMLWANLALGIGLGIYTGILLSALGTARPAWNSAILGPLFLVSGFSTGAALMMLLPVGHEEHGVLRKLDMWAIGVELALLVLFLVTLASAGAQPERDVAGMFFGGRFTATFWSLVVIAGLLAPLTLELLESKNGHKPTALAPALLLIGGLSLRWILVMAGQA